MALPERLSRRSLRHDVPWVTAASASSVDQGPRFAAGAPHTFALSHVSNLDDQLAMTDETWSLVNEDGLAEHEPLAAEFLHDAPSEDAAQALARELEPAATQRWVIDQAPSR